MKSPNLSLLRIFFRILIAKMRLRKQNKEQQAKDLKNYKIHSEDVVLRNDAASGKKTKKKEYYKSAL
jgi:hypothetical protein